MVCPACQHAESRVVDSRDAGDAVRRRRECEACSHRFTTFEHIEYRLPAVVKRDGRHQTFDAPKLRAALKLACRKRPVGEEALDDAVAKVEEALSKNTTGEVTTEQIGQLALDTLRDLDTVAWLRFASVYQEVSSPEDFLALIQPLLRKKR